MKSLFLGLLLVSSSVFANEVVILSSNEDYELSKVPQNLMATFVDQGFKQVETSKGVYELNISNLRCDYTSRDALFPDYSNGGLSSVKCMVNAEPVRFGKGKKVEESRYIAEIINVVESKAGGEYSDCAMGGKCTTFISSIKCVVDLNQEEMHKAYSCILK